MPPQSLCKGVPVFVGPALDALAYRTPICLGDRQCATIGLRQRLFDCAAQVLVPRGGGRALPQISFIAFCRPDDSADAPGLVTANTVEQRAFGATGTQLQAYIARPVRPVSEGAEQQTFAFGTGPSRHQHAFQGTYKRQFAVCMFNLLAQPGR